MTQGTAQDVAANAVPPLDAFRDPTLARSLIDTIHALAGGHAINLMEVCGTHTVSISRYGFRSVMPDGLRLLSGPGCPVCVTANQDVDHAIALARVPGAIIATFGDMMRVPGSTSSLAAEKAAGRDVRMVYSPLDALSLAHDNPGSEVIFMGVGFETTTPTIAAAILEAQAQNLRNFSVFCAHKTTPPALRAIAGDPHTHIDGFILPGHVSTITGIEPYRFLVDEFHIPGVITGFEPIDVLEGIAMLVNMVEKDEPAIQNAYRRGVDTTTRPRRRGSLCQPTAAELRRSSSPAATTVGWPSAAPSTMWQLRGRDRSICRADSSWRRAIRSQTCGASASPWP